MKKVNLTTIALSSVMSVLIISTANACNGNKSRRLNINHAQIVSQLNLDAKTKETLIKLMDKHRAQGKAQANKNKQLHKENHKMRGVDVLNLLGEEKFSEFSSIMREKREERCKGYN